MYNFSVIKNKINKRIHAMFKVLLSTKKKPLYADLYEQSR